MNDQALVSFQEFSRNWARTMTSMLCGPLVMLDTGLQAAQKVLAATARTPGRPALDPGEAGLDAVVRHAADRMAKGLAPPREIYQAPYRNRIDWSRFPDWARPVDPELFEGSGHEG
jgi:hypothetical protein